MAIVPNPPPVIRVPNLPVGKVVDEEGSATQEELTFRHALITGLQTYFGNEGLVAPTQANTTAPADYITQIQNNKLPNGQYTCQYGTILYNSTANSVMIAVNNGSGQPVFKTVTLLIIKQ